MCLISNLLSQEADQSEARRKDLRLMKEQKKGPLREKRVICVLIGKRLIKNCLAPESLDDYLSLFNLAGKTIVAASPSVWVPPRCTAEATNIHR